MPPRLTNRADNLLSDPSFEVPNFKVCTHNCNAASGWSIEHSTDTSPRYYRSATGAVTGSASEALVYKGHPSDNGVHKEIELYHGAAGPDTVAGNTLTFTLWVSGTCHKCAPFIGIEAFNKHNRYLGESDQYFQPPATPKAVQVSYVLPAGTVVVASYLQVPELYSQSSADLRVDAAALLVSSKQLDATSRSSR